MVCVPLLLYSTFTINASYFTAISCNLLLFLFEVVELRRFESTYFSCFVKKTKTRKCLLNFDEH
jgi:hypothetical protein